VVASLLLNHIHGRIAYFDVVGEATFWVAEGGVGVVKLLKFGGSDCGWQVGGIGMVDFAQFPVRSPNFDRRCGRMQP